MRMCGCANDKNTRHAELVSAPHHTEQLCKLSARHCEARRQPSLSELMDTDKNKSSIHNLYAVQSGSTSQAFSFMLPAFSSKRALPAAGLSAHTARALATGPVSAAIPNAGREDNHNRAACGSRR